VYVTFGTSSFGSALMVESPTKAERESTTLERESETEAKESILLVFMMAESALALSVANESDAVLPVCANKEVENTPNRIMQII